MIFRDYQSRAINRATKALSKHGNTLVVAPTGAGKTVMMGGLVGEVKPERVVILQHRDELVSQNLEKFRRINPKFSTSLFTAENKSWAGRSIFAMVQTLCRPKNLSTMPALDMMVIDECHHYPSESYKKIVNHAKDLNPKIMIAGFTATPMRADKKGLRAAFDNVADQITIRELINLGFLVPPVAFVIDVEGVKEGLATVRKLANDFDPGQVEAVMNKKVINAEVIKHWKEKAGDRKTIVFCSTVQHAKDVLAVFEAAGVSAAMVDGETHSQQRKNLLRRFKAGDVQVIVNVGVLVEGFDEPTVSCIVLLRPCSFKSTMIQMIGRGLRVVNPRENPGVVKKDCIVLDFGASLITHGNIDVDIELEGRDGKEGEAGEAPVKVCPTEDNHNTPYLVPDINGFIGCGAEVPARSAVCPLCGFTFCRPGGDDVFDAVQLTEIDLLDRSPFRWVDLFGSGKILVASGFGTWAAAICPNGNDTWHALGKAKDSRRVLSLGQYGKPQAVAAADDFLREHETGLAANKARSWMADPASTKQGELLQRAGYMVEFGPFGVANFTKLTATAHLNFQWNRTQIERIIGA